MLICSVVGARPNFMKMAPVVGEIRKRGIGHYFVHTGQHYDDNMSRVFFDELEMPRPDVDLDVGSDTPARQTARIMMAFEDVCRERRPDLILVGGDVNSTAAVALVAAKERIPLGHVEAGLRSFDRTMPEEINRVVTDHLSDYLFTTEESANENLALEGIPRERVYFVGNCMVDTLKKHVSVALERAPWADFGLRPDGYALLTFTVLRTSIQPQRLRVSWRRSRAYQRAFQSSFRYIPERKPASKWRASLRRTTCGSANRCRM